MAQHPDYGQVDERWERLCKPYADRFWAMFKGRGYFAVVDDERGVFIVIGGRQFDAPTLGEAFDLALPFATEYAAIFDEHPEWSNEQVYRYWKARDWK